MVSPDKVYSNHQHPFIPLPMLSNNWISALHTLKFHTHCSPPETGPRLRPLQLPSVTALRPFMTSFLWYPPPSLMAFHLGQI